jgi:hypothetical protein
MNRFAPVLLAVLLLVLRPAAAEQILPHSLGPWAETAGGSAVTMPAEAVLAEYGLRATESATYSAGRSNGGGDQMRVTVFQMKDPSGAYGLYSFLRTPDMARAEFAEHSAMSRARALVLCGNLVLDIAGQDLARLTSQINSLVAAAATRAQNGPLPTLWQHLPPKGLVERSDRYILGPETLNQLFPANLGDALGFSKGAEAELAHYRLASHDVTLLIADFPTPGFAAQQLAELQKQFDVNGSKPGGASPALFAKRDLTLLAIVADAPNQAEASALLDQIQSGTQLTWDEPTFQFKEPSIEMMVVGSILGTGIICGFALIAGLAFGGFRLFIKRMLPGKIFDRGTQLQVLQLGLASKPINAEDFYGSVGAVEGATTVDKNLPDRIALRIFR